MPDESGSQRQWAGLLAEQFSQHSRLFFKLAYGVLRESTAAEDACQQAMLRALQHPAELRIDGALRAWLARIVVNESLQVRRRQRIEQRVLANHATRSPAMVGAGGGNPRLGRAADRGGDGGGGAEPDALWELREAIVEALDQLPEPARAVVAMRLLDGMTGGQVKELLQCSDAHVSRELHRGMEMLRAVLHEWDASSEKIG